MTSKNGIIYISLGLIAAILTTWAISERGNRITTLRDLNKEKLKSESLISERLAVEKDRDKSRGEADREKTANKRLTQELSELEAKLDENSKAMNRLRSEYAMTRKKYDQLFSERKSLGAQLKALSGERDQIQLVNQQLHNEVASAKASNDQLLQELELVKLTWFDKPLIKATRGSSNKLMVKASRVQKLTATVQLSARADNLKFAVINPSGSTLTESDGDVTSRILSRTDETHLTEISFSPKKKLQPGLYQIEVVNAGTHIASLQVFFEVIRATGRPDPGLATLGFLFHYNKNRRCHQASTRWRFRLIVRLQSAPHSMA